MFGIWVFDDNSHKNEVSAPITQSTVPDDLVSESDNPVKGFSATHKGQVFDNFSQRAGQTFQELSLMKNDLEIIGPVLSKNMESKNKVCGNSDLIPGAYRLPFIINGQGIVVGEDKHSRTDVDQMLDICSQHTGQSLVDNEVVESLRDG
ncbi:hypothetical protein RND71_003658 [Anisodus tanguticus]|uniref:Uncharacterized protein n=1 Tax=Anisodus tanguticus TaxID=243964 RepID=A0AAE1VQ66_9SOLA|nr:hypothetical protein RND71_003658 [Anisodus tanguticus]